MLDIRFDPARRSLLIRAGELIGGLTVAGVFSASAHGTARMAKTDFQYQDHRHDGKGCDQCKFFREAATGADAGTCSVVEGPISRDGWCMAFTPKGGQ